MLEFRLAPKDLVVGFMVSTPTDLHFSYKSLMYFAIEDLDPYRKALQIREYKINPCYFEGFTIVGST